MPTAHRPLLLALSILILAGGCSDNTLQFVPLNLCQCRSDQICVEERCVAVGDRTLLDGRSATMDVSADMGGGCDTSPARIEELRYGGESLGDFIELSGAAGVALGGWRVRGLDRQGRRVTDVSLSGNLNAEGLWLGAFGRLEDGTVVDLALGSGGFTSPSGSVQLIDCEGTLRDAVGYGVFETSDRFEGEGTPAAAVTEAEGSLGRCPDADDSGDNALDFQPNATPSPGVANAELAMAPGCQACDLGSSYAGTLWLNEVHYDPSGADEDSAEAFVELRGTPGLVLSGLWLQSWDRTTARWVTLAAIEGETTADEGRFVLGEVGATGAADLEIEGVDLANDGGALRVLECGDRVVSSLGYGIVNVSTSGVEEVAGDSGDGASLARCPDASTLDPGSDWEVSAMPSRGAANTCP